MHKKPNTEVELSPYVQKHWRDMGFCVHGEVAIYGDGSFVDHVAHLGPCHAPEYVVAIEMKKGASLQLRKQIWSLDRQHVADEIWGVTITPPRTATLDTWKGVDNGPRSNLMSITWHEPGLLTWRDGDLHCLRECRVTLRNNHKRYYRKNTNRLLLVPENKDTLGGFPSGDADYITHWSLGLSHIEKLALSLGEFTTEDVYSNLHPCMQSYKKPKGSALRMLKCLVDKGILVSKGKEGKWKKYKLNKSL